MADITPIDKLPELNPHQLQQILLERDESAERLIRVTELEVQLKNKDEEIKKLSDEAIIKDSELSSMKEEKTAKDKETVELNKQVKENSEQIERTTSTLLSIGSSLSAALALIQGTPEYKEHKLMLATEAKNRADALLAEINQDKGAL